MGNSVSPARELFLVVNPLTLTYSLTDTPIEDTETVSLNGAIQYEGVTEDYIVSGMDIIFTSNVSLTTGDKILVSYFK